MLHFCPYKTHNELRIHKYPVAKLSNALPAYTKNADTWERVFQEERMAIAKALGQEGVHLGSSRNKEARVPAA